MAPQKKTELKQKGASRLIKTYLIAYNFIETLGWSYLLYQLINYYLYPTTQKTLYDTVKCSLMIFQNAAVLEVIHAATRIVPSNPIITAVQVASRVFVVCGILLVTRAARETVGLPLALLAWSITEVIRYANYTFDLLEIKPYFIAWLRYTLFIVLYPMGITGELLCIYAAQNEISVTKKFTIEMPNSLNFTFNYQFLLWLVMFSYIPFFPRLYIHMFAQRIRVLGRYNQPKKD